MNDEPLSIITIISIAVVVLIGLIIFFIGKLKKKRNLWILGIGFLLSASVISFVESAEIRSTLTALAAVIAVFVAAMSFEGSKQLRKEALEREKREGKIQLLTDIIGWAEDLSGCSSSENMVIQQSAGNLLQRYRHILSKKAYIKEVISSFDDNEFNTLLSTILIDGGPLNIVMAGLAAIERNDIQIDGKKEISQLELKQEKPNSVKLANIAGELAQLHTASGLKWIELIPKDKQLADDVDDLIKHASTLKINLISEYSPID